MNIVYSVDKFFDLEDDVYLLHFVAADWGIDTGVYGELDDEYGLQEGLMHCFPNRDSKLKKFNMISDCIIVNNIINLVVKMKAFKRPTYHAIKAAFHDLKNAIDNKEEFKDFPIKKIAIPLNKNGLEELDWNRVLKVIENKLGDTDVEILLCQV